MFKNVRPSFWQYQENFVDLECVLGWRVEEDFVSGEILLNFIGFVDCRRFWYPSVRPTKYAQSFQIFQ